MSSPSRLRPRRSGSLPMLPRALGNLDPTRRTRGMVPKGLVVLLVALVACVLVALRLQGAATAPGGGPTRSTSLRGPNFDFDLFRTSPTIPELQSDRDDASDDQESDSDADDGDGDGESESESDELAEDVLEDDDDLHVLHAPIPPALPLPAPATRSFLPFTCAASCAEPGLRSAHEQSTCTKYNAPNAPNATYDPFFLDRSVLFPGTGHEVRRVLTRAIKSSLYGTRRREEGTTSPTTPYEDEEPFQILILGGSVSNCRGVDPYTECWHSRVLDWFQRTLPLEGDPRPVAPEPVGPQRLAAAAHLRRTVERRTVTSTLVRLAKRTLVPRIVKPPLAAVALKDVKKAVSKLKSKKKKKKKPKATAPGGRKRPVTRMINGAKSATGSAFYAYCFEAEMAARGKSDKWGRGPDLVVLEFGVNDVWPTSPVASRDFERLLTHLRALPSAPALVILEAASLLLARTQPATTAAEYLHLAPAHFHDVPVLSTKHALFGPATALRPDAGLAMPELFLPDLHHPNARGHELLADTLTAYLEHEACTVQRQLQASAQSDDLAPPPRKDELVLPRPARSLFEPFGEEARSSPFEQPAPTCLQVGNSKSKTVPSKNVGWTKYSWARDKQYLVADKPGSIVTFDVVVGLGGEVLVDWLRSRFYDLGNVLCYVDGQKSSGATLAGWWDLGWSIGVPTIVHSGLTPGKHTISFELLPSALSSHPGQKTNFRLIGLITT